MAAGPSKLMPSAFETTLVMCGIWEMPITFQWSYLLRLKIVNHIWETPIVFEVSESHLGNANRVSMELSTVFEVCESRLGDSALLGHRTQH